MSAKRLFTKRGVASTSVGALPETAGYSRGASRQFGSRDEILDTYVARGWSEDSAWDSPPFCGLPGACWTVASYICCFLLYCARQPLDTRPLIAGVTHRAVAGADVNDELEAASLSEVVATQRHQCRC